MVQFKKRSNDIDAKLKIKTKNQNLKHETFNF